MQDKRLNSGSNARLPATLRFPDGALRTHKVRDDVDLNAVKLGDEVVIRVPGAMSLSVAKL